MNPKWLTCKQNKKKKYYYLATRFQNNLEMSLWSDRVLKGGSETFAERKLPVLILQPSMIYERNYTLYELNKIL